MALLSPLQRWLAPLVVAALMVPSVGMLFTAAQSTSTAENRRLAPPPVWPQSLRDWGGLPRQLDLYLADHFAFRQVLTSADNQLHWRLGGQIARGDVVRGKDDRLFLRDDLLTATGGVVRADVADDYARFLCGMHARLTARGIPMVFAMAPSPAVLYPEDLPDWVPRGRTSDYDLILAGARACGVNTVDLRPPLRAAKPTGSIYYHHDSHWTPKGALIAYDALVAALNRPDWRIAPDQLTWRRAPEPDQDLARMAGAANLTPQSMDTPDLANRRQGLVRTLMPGVDDKGGRPSFIDVTGAAGPTVLFIGDSYSADFMPPYFASFVGRFAWMHQQWCGFDWRAVDLLKPDYVVVMPVDHAAACKRGRRPRNWPAT